jgi:hypothetical protein
MNPIVRNIMALAHRWALATYNKALDKPFEDFDEIQKALQAAIEQALKPGEAVGVVDQISTPFGPKLSPRLLKAVPVGTDLYTTPQPQPKQEVVAEVVGWDDEIKQPIIHWLRGAWPPALGKLYTTPQPQPDDTALLRQALEYLERSVDNYPTGQALSRSCHEDTIAALRERLK